MKKISQRKYSLVKKNLAACIVDGMHYHQNLDWIDEIKTFTMVMNIKKPFAIVIQSSSKAT